MAKTMTVKEWQSQMGRKGGKARAKKLSKDRRVEIGKLAAQARWKNHKKASAA